jgi:ribosomal protein S18 acetylase RimI-like enzyme
VRDQATEAPSALLSPFLFVQHLFQPSLSCLVATQHDGELVGYLTATTLRDTSATYISSICTSVKARRTGVATRLLTSPSLSAQALELHVDAANGAARSFYRYLGFRETGRQASYYRACGGSDALVMRR